ncbi:MAG: hypothetical protein ABSG31_15730 [Tepidisphaeraceae bacterium]|jgi:hypothetical protein
MRWAILTVAAMGCLLGGCAASSPPPSSAANTGSTDTNGSPPPVASVASNPTDDTPVPPPGALYTLLCQTFMSPTHVADANRLKEQLIAQTRDQQWYCIHMTDESDLFYGYYKTYDDRSQMAEFNRAQSDRARIASMVSDVGDPLFGQVFFQPISLPDPPAPKEWELAANPGFWTLEIGQYKDNPLRKQAAVDAVRILRSQGVEAYFRHYPNWSEIYVGSWPRSAVKEQDTAEASTTDRDKEIVVFGGEIRGFDPSQIETFNGKPAQVFMPRVDVQDPTLHTAMEQYQYLLVNGVPMGRAPNAGPHAGHVLPYPSFLIQVPHDQDQDSDAADQKAWGQGMGQGMDSDTPAHDPMVPIPEPGATPPNQ